MERDKLMAWRLGVSLEPILGMPFKTLQKSEELIELLRAPLSLLRQITLAEEYGRKRVRAKIQSLTQNRCNNSARVRLR